MIYYGKTDTGTVREENQDTFSVTELQLQCVDSPVILAVVCDGMGGAAAGNLASKIAGESFIGYVKRQLDAFDEDLSSPKNIPFEKLLRDGVRYANDRVIETAQTNIVYKGMGTTLVGILVIEKMLYAVNIGDSRMYAYTDGVLTKITHDHSFVQSLIDKGVITESAAEHHPSRNLILKAVGASDIPEPDVYVLDSFPDTVLLCSDGLYSMVTPEEIIRILGSAENIQNAVDLLIDTANKNGGTDNITAFALTFNENQM